MDTMMLSDLIKHLQQLKRKHGNLVVVGSEQRAMTVEDISLISKTLPRVDHERRTIAMWPEVCAVRFVQKSEQLAKLARSFENGKEGE